MFLIIGSDARLKYTAEFLNDAGHNISVYANDDISMISGIKVYTDLKEAMENNTCILFGIPFSRDGHMIYTPFSDEKVYTDDILKNIKPHHIVLGGKMDNFSVSVSKKGARCVDYGLREDFCLYNAHITAEAIISVIMDKLPVTVSGLKCLIMGYGRIGKALSKKMSALGADVTVTARKSSDFAMIDIAGYKYQKTSDLIDRGDSFDIIVNTIPFKVLTNRTFESLKKSCLVIDASAYPGFVDRDIAGQYGIEVEGAFSMPGKFAPVTAGKIIADVVLNICNEAEILKTT